MPSIKEIMNKKKINKVDLWTTSPKLGKRRWSKGHGSFFHLGMEMTFFPLNYLAREKRFTLVTLALIIIIIKNLLGLKILQRATTKNFIRKKPISKSHCLSKIVFFSLMIMS